MTKHKANQKKEVYVQGILDIQNVLYRMNGVQMDYWHQEIEKIAKDIIHKDWEINN